MSMPGEPADPAAPAEPVRATLRLRAVSKAFGPHPVLRGIDLEVPSGALAAVLGPSGSGKTTLLRVVAGFERPDGGSVEIGGVAMDDDREHVPVERRRIGYVPQEGSLFPHLDVRANVGFGLRRARRGGRARRVADLLELVGLEDCGDRYPHQLSGGQQQRVALARALATSPSLVLLDEPFASLDANLRGQVRREVRDVLRRAGATALLVTHDQDEALSVADVVAVLREGVIAQADSPTMLYAHPVDPDVAAFVGDANLLEGTASGTSVDTVLGRLTAHRPVDGDGRTVTVLVRPEQLVLRLGSAAATPAGAVGGGSGAGHGPGPASVGLPARVTSAEYHGHDTTVRLSPLVAGLPAAMVARVVGKAALVPDTVVRVSAHGPVQVWKRNEPARALTESPS